MAIKSYIRGFAAYPVDTRQMMTNTNALLSTAALAISASDSVNIGLSNTNIQWTYFGSQVFMTIFYQVP